MAAQRRSLPEQLAAAKAEQLGEVWVRTKSPEGVVTERAYWMATEQQLVEIVKAGNKITEGNR